MQAEENMPEMAKQPSVPGLIVIKPVHDRFPAAIDSHGCRLLKRSSQYEENVVHEFQKMAKKIAMQMKDRTFPGRARCR